MKKISLIIVLLFINNNNFASNFGTTGIIEIPSSRMLDDGDMKITFSNQEIANITNITYQATPWLQTTFRYNYGKYQDRSYSAKITIFNEGNNHPEVAIGVKDLLGTGLFSSEYIVASKNVDNFDISLGLGWGRLSERNSLKNPLIVINNSFENRFDVNGGGRYGGKLRSNSFFKGSNAGVFGGIVYKIPHLNLKLLAEYNTDSYSQEISSGAMNSNSPLSYGIQWTGIKGFDFNIHHLMGNEIAFSVSSTIATKSPPPKHDHDKFYSSLDGHELSNAPQSYNLDSWYDRLLHDFEQSGLLLRSASISSDNLEVTIELSNFRYGLTADAIQRALTLTQIHIPNNINKINILLNENGYKSLIIEYTRNNLLNKFIMSNNPASLELSPPSNIANPIYITKIKTPSLTINANLATRFQLFDPDKPLKHQVYLKIGSVIGISQSLKLVGSYALDINNNFDTIRGSASRLEHVRTDINRYLVEGQSGIESLYLEKYSTIKDAIYYRLYLGVLESMYSGLGIEVFYQPYKSRIAFGGTINRVIKRGYKRDFELLNYKTTTGFLSIYYASPFYNYDLALHVGKYLAKDKGATFEVRRTFDNGFSIGAFATLTDVSAADYGEGSFDKGLTFRIPFDSFSIKNTKSSFSTMIRSLQRDGGQRLDDFSGRLWHDLRNVRYDSLQNNKGRMQPK